MSNYRRSKSAGGTFFFTVVTYNRQKLFSQALARELLRQSITEVRTNHPFTIDAWVLLPDHLHCIWTLPENDADFSTRWGCIKANFSKKAKALIDSEQPATDSRKRHREASFWQRRFWEHQIRDDVDFRNHMDYICFNPVKHGLVDRVKDWPYSTFHRMVLDGIYSENWGRSNIDAQTYNFGE